MDQYIILRPFKDIEDSVTKLFPYDVFLYGKLKTSKVIIEFLKSIKNKKPSNIIKRNLNLLYYWNNGKPYLYDIVEYYRFALWHHTCLGGDDIDFIEDYWDEIEDSKFRLNESKWNEANSNVHLLHLIDKNPIWYKRFAIQYKNLKLKNDCLYTADGNPRSIKYNQIENQTYNVNRYK